MCAIQRMGHWIKWPFVCRPPLGNFPQVMSEWKERFRSLVSSFITLEVLMAASSVSALLDRISVLTLPSFPWDWSSQKAATDNVKGTTRTRPKKYSVGILIILTCFVQQDEISSEFTYTLGTSACSCPLTSSWFLFCPGMGYKHWRTSSSKIKWKQYCNILLNNWCCWLMGTGFKTFKKQQKKNKQNIISLHTARPA